MVSYAATKKIAERVFISEVQSHSRKGIIFGSDNSGYPPTVALTASDTLLATSLVALPILPECNANYSGISLAPAPLPSPPLSTSPLRLRYLPSDTGLPVP